MAISNLSNQNIQPAEAIKGSDIREGILRLIQIEHPDFSNDSILSLEELNKYRRLYLTTLVEQEKGELASLDQDVMQAIRNNSILSENIQDEIESRLATGQKVADKIASFGGSWIFIIAFFSFLLLWMITNVWLISTKPFDPYPFILLNLILSCLAAIQAPIIMMSQNRQEQIDRQRAEHDYKINLKAELEIRHLHQKVDHLLSTQWERLMEIQKIQMELISEIRERK